MGLHFQRHQEIPPEPQLRSARSLSCYHDCTVHGRLCAAADQNLPQARSARHGKLLRHNTEQVRRR